MTDTSENEAQELLDSRRAVYGDRVDNMERTALIWSGLLGFTVQPFQVPMMMAAYKMLRAQLAPDYSDNIDDVDGWNIMFREIIGDDLIQARTVEEFLEKKKKRQTLQKAPKPTQDHRYGITDPEEIERLRLNPRPTKHWAPPTVDQTEGKAIAAWERALQEKRLASEARLKATPAMVEAHKIAQDNYWADYRENVYGSRDMTPEEQEEFERTRYEQEISEAMGREGR